jgi:predicted dinucleotide-utilizing enzyme
MSELLETEISETFHQKEGRGKAGKLKQAIKNNETSTNPKQTDSK